MPVDKKTIHWKEVIWPDVVDFLGTAGIIVPQGTTAQRPIGPVEGYLRFNTSLVIFEGFFSGIWQNIGIGVGATTFDGLTDTPVNKVASGGRFMRVNAAETDIVYETGLVIDGSGRISVAGTANYEALVTTDDVLPNKKYVDDRDALYLLLAGGIMAGNIGMGGNRVTGAATIPIASDELVTKAYADSLAAGLDPKESVRIATDGEDLTAGAFGGTYNAGGGTGGTGNITGVDLTNAIDGNVALLGDRLLLKDQGAPIQNGIYVVTIAGGAGEVERAPDQDGTPTNEVSGGNYTYVEIGATNFTAGFSLVFDGIVTLNVDPLVWTQISFSGGPFLPLTGGTMTGSIVGGAPGMQFLGDVAAPAAPAFSFFPDPGTGLHQIAGPGTMSFIIGTAPIWDIVIGSMAPAVTLTQDIGTAGLKIKDFYGDHHYMNFGAAGDPSFSFEGDTNTGMYRSGADTLAFAIGGTGVAFWSAAELDFTAIPGTGAGAGGDVDINAGVGGTTGDGGSVTVDGGAGGATSGDGGDITLTGGSAVGGGAGGTVSMIAGTGASVGGGVVLTAGDSSGADTGGVVTIDAGAGGATGDGGSIDLTGGVSGSAGDGGIVNIAGGVSVSVGSTEYGGDVNITGGAVTGAGISPGGDVTIKGGAATDGSAGDVIIEGGVSTTNQAGIVLINGGAGAPTTAGGVVTITTGAGGGTSGNSGALTLATGATTSGIGGTISLMVGASAGANTGGPINITAGTGGTVGAGGTASLVGGDGGSVSGAGGDANLTGGDATTSGAGGDANVTAGTGLSAGGVVNIIAGGSTGTDPGGAVNVTAGIGGTGAGGDGGAVVITAGAAGAASASDGGDIELRPGAADGAGTDGIVSVIGPGTGAAGEMRLEDNAGGQYIGLQAAGVISSSFTLTLPAADATTSGQVLSSNAAGVLSFVSAGSVAGSKFDLAFTNATLAGGILTVTHNLGRKFVHVTVYNNTDVEIQPDTVTATSTTQTTIDLTSFGVLTGTWNVVVS